MHSYTLTNWDGSQSRNEDASNNLQNSDSNLKHKLPQGRDKQIFKTPPGAAFKNDVERGNDANYGVQFPEHRNRKVVEEKGTRPGQSLMSVARTVEEGNRTTSASAEFISQAYDTPASSSRNQASTIKIHSNSRTQDQAKLLPQSQTTKFSPVPLTRINAHTGPTHVQSTLQHDKQGPAVPTRPHSGSIAQSQAIADTHANTIYHAENTTVTNTRVQTICKSRTEMDETTRPIKETIVHGGLDPVLTRKPPVVLPLTRPGLDTPSAPSPVGRRPKAVPNTVLGARRLKPVAPKVSGPLFKPDIAQGAANNYPKTLKEHVSLATETNKQRAPTVLSQSPNYSPYFVSLQPPLPLPPNRFSPPTHSGINSSVNPRIGDQPVPSSVPSSPVLPLDPLLSDTHHDNGDDECTSADADGESINESVTFESLESSQPPAHLQSNIQATQSTRTNSVIIHPWNHASHTSVYDLFTPPPTRSPSQIPTQPIKHQLPIKPRLSVHMLHVEVPPLPPGVRKADYRPLKRLKRALEDDYETQYIGGRNSGKAMNKKRKTFGESWEREKEGQQSARKTEAQQGSTLPASTARSGPRRDTTAEKRASGTSDLQQTPSTSTATDFRRPPPPSPVPAALPGLPKPSVGPTTPVASSAVHRPPSKSHSIASKTGRDNAASSIQELTANKLRVHTAQHLSPTATYFNTRFAQPWLKDDPTEWAALGVRATMECLRPGKFSWDQRLSSDVGEEGDEGEANDLSFGVGGTLLWRGCSSDEEEEIPLIMVRLQNRKQETIEAPKVAEHKTKISTVTSRKSGDGTSGTIQPPVTPMPKVDLTKVLKERSLSARRAYSTKERNTHTGVRTRHDVEPSDPSASIASPSRRQPQSRITSEYRPEPPPYLSEKARGKQKAVDPHPPDMDSHGAYTTTLSCPVMADLPDPNVGSYTANASAGEPSTMVPAFAPSSEPVHQRHGDPFRPFQVNVDDLFLPSHNPAISVFNGLDIVEGFNAYDDPFGMLTDEKDSQLATVNSTFLEGVHDDAHTMMDAMELDFEVPGIISEEDMEIEDQRPQDIIYRDELLKMKSSYQPAAGSPIISLSNSSSSSSSTSSRSSRSLSRAPTSTRSISQAAVGRTSSPEFPDVHATSRSSNEEHAQLSNSNSTSPFPIPRVQRRPSYSRTRVLDTITDEEEEEVRQDLDIVNKISSISDGHFIPIPDSKDEPLRERPTPEQRPGTPPAVPVATLAVIARRGQEWECGQDNTFCHQCRRTTHRLKMTCICKKRFCNRCISIRYPSIQFRLQWDGFGCPYCRNECNCDQCTRKRGEVYVSIRASLGQIPKGSSLRPVSRPRRQMPPRVWSASPSPEIIPLPSPEPTEDITGPFSFWGSVYDMKGSKIANGFAGPGDRVVIANAVGGYTRPKDRDNRVERDLPAVRTFIGAYQPSWKLGRAPIIKELEKRGRSRRMDTVVEDPDDVETRWFVGKERLLHCPVVVYTRDLERSNPLNDMSSLSSLSDDSDIEVDHKNTASEDRTIPNPVNIIDNIKKEGRSSVNFNPNAIETRDTVRALLIALEACGMMVKAEQSLANL